MATATLEDRVTSLERRMSELEGPVGFLLPTVRQIHLDLLGFKEDVGARFDRMDAKFTHKFDSLDAKFDGLATEVGRLGAQVNRFDAKVDRLDAKVNGLDAKVDAMPRAVAEIVAGLIKK
jgi:outer membrane murein-binding lipoprotein Lpp